MRPLSSAQEGFSLIELLIALTLGAVVLLSVERLLPQIWLQATALEQRQLARAEGHRLLLQLEKAIRRAGFCNGDNCKGVAMEIKDGGKCLLLRWDDNANGQWEGIAHPQSDYFGYRHRDNLLESARGGGNCQLGHWSRLNQPSQVQIIDFSVQQVGARVEVVLTIKAGKYTLRRKHIVNRENS